MNKKNKWIITIVSTILFFFAFMLLNVVLYTFTGLSLGLFFALGFSALFFILMRQKLKLFKGVADDTVSTSFEQTKSCVRRDFISQIRGRRFGEFILYKFELMSKKSASAAMIGLMSKFDIELAADFIDIANLTADYEFLCKDSSDAYVELEDIASGVFQKVKLTDEELFELFEIFMLNVVLAAYDDYQIKSVLERFESSDDDFAEQPKKIIPVNIPKNRSADHPVKTDKQAVDLYARAVDKPVNDSPNEPMDMRLKKTLIVSAAILISLLMILLFVSWLKEVNQKTTNDLFEISVPSGWDVEQSDAGGLGHSVVISRDDEMLALVCFYEEMDMETAMEYSNLLQFSDDKLLRGATYSRAFDATIGNYPARQRAITNYVNNKKYSGRLSLVAVPSRTMFIIDVRDAYMKSRADEVLSTLRFVETPANPKSVTTRMKAQIKSLSSKLPQQMDELTVYQSVKIVDKALVHTYTITEDLGLNKQELESFCVQAKIDQCEHIVNLNSSLTMEWLNDGYVITYKYNDKQNNELFRFTISKDDLN